MGPQVRLAKRGPNATPLPYTASPLRLLARDLCLCVRYAWALPLLFFPLRLGRTSPLDELHPSVPSGISLGFQTFFTVTQLLFLASLPLLVILMIPTLWMLVYMAAFLSVNYAICMVVLNGFHRIVVSQVPVPERPDQGRECWFFINGVTGGHYWLQNTVNQLSYTFGRKITGIHNRTAGLVFDLIECLVQRCFSYATGDVRKAYVLIKAALLRRDCEKVVLILHSQGGIEGGLIADWLLDELPRDILQKLEIYTFGNAANHFNNPRHRRDGESESSQTSNAQTCIERSVGYIEHYANSGDVVSWLGVLHFVGFPNRYMGRLFVRQGTGHMMNQHYLHNMFTLGPDNKVLDSNPFMDLEVEVRSNMPANGSSDSRSSSTANGEETLLPLAGPGQQMTNGDSGGAALQVLRIKDFSRLWQYRNGGSPERYKSE